MELVSITYTAGSQIVHLETLICETTIVLPHSSN